MTSLLDYEWNDRQTRPDFDTEACARTLGISSLTASIISVRTTGGVDQVRDYWQPRLEDLGEPELLKDMTKAAKRLATAVRTGEKIVIWGDYDVDGATSVSLLMRFFNFVGTDVDFHIPNRLTDGYGLNVPGLKAIKDQGAAVVITVDNGISALEQADEAKRLGLDLIITDHHEPGDVLPAAYAVVDPKQPGCPSTDKSIAGVGVAFKLSCAVARQLANGRDLSDEMKQLLLSSLSLVAVGTIADLVPLTGENRVFAGYGLHQLNVSSWPGLRSLMEVSECRGQAKSSDVAFRLGPRINAAGRLASADTGVRLMTTEDPGVARVLAEELDRSNTERRAIERTHTQQALEIVEGADVSEIRAVTLAGDGWHPGVIGIVASRLVDKVNLPTVVCAFDGDLGKASCRSVEGFHLHEVLTRCADHLESYGGHAMAAGFTIRRANWENFKAAFQAEAAATLNARPRRGVRIDSWIDLVQLDDAIMNEIDHMAPFGMNNPRPLLAVRGVQLTDIRRLGRDGSHLSFRSTAPGVAHRSIAYRAGSLAKQLAKTNEWDLAFEPVWNNWNGRRSIELNIKALRPTGIAG